MSFTLVAPIVLSLLAGASSQTEAEFRFVPDQILVICREGVTDSACRRSIGTTGRTVLRRFRLASDPASVHNRRYLVRIRPGTTVERALESVRGLPEVEAAQPNYLYRALQSPPDDTYYWLQWGLENTGDNSAHDIYGLQGPDPRIPDSDTDHAGARAIYDGLTLDPVIVAIADTGLDLTHEDLAPNLWTNAAEVPGNGLDDDSNGYDDDVHGWDFVVPDGDPADEDGHGTHVAGTVGAVINNGTGVSGGGAPNVKIMPLRVAAAEGGADTSRLIEAITYGVDNGARVLNNSWGGGPWEEALFDAIEAARDAGVLFVSAAGNDGSDNDQTSHYPSDYDLDNIISVGASTPWRDLADFSNYGATSVDIAAPGDQIASTTPPTIVSGQPGWDYQIGCYEGGSPHLVPWSGTSMASPAVSAAAAMVFGLGGYLWPATWGAMTPVERMTAVRNRILERAERWPALSGKTATDGHLNLFNLLEDDVIAPDSVSPSFGTEYVGPDFVKLGCTAPGDDGAAGGSANYYDLRYEPGPAIDYDNAARVRDVWTPGSPGLADSFTVTGLQPDTEYTFGLKVVDNAGNTSGLATVTMVTRGVVEFFSDDMESGAAGWLAEGSWSLTTEDHASGSWSWTDSPGGSYGPDQDVSLYSPEIAADGSPPAVSFMHHYDLETGADFGYVEARSWNGGVWGAWTGVTTFTGTDPAWHAVSVDLPVAGEKVQVRFRLVTDASNHYDGWFIDDVIVSQSTNPPLMPFFEDTFDGDDCSQWALVGDWGCESSSLSDSPGADYAFNNRASAVVGPLSFSGMQAVGVSFDLAALDYESGVDHLLFQYGLDGTSWRTLGRFTGSGTGTQSFEIDALAGMPSVWFRFLSLTDYQNAAGGARIDNFRVETAAMVTCIEDLDCDDLDECTMDTCNSVVDCVYLPVTESPPPEVPLLTVARDVLSWDGVAGARAYDLVVGDLGSLAEMGLTASVMGCPAENEPSTSIPDSSMPPAGSGWWYVVRGGNCGGPGGYGHGRDAAIDASINACLP